MAVAQISIEYCNALVNDTGKRAAYWPGFGFPANIASAFGPGADRDLILDPLVDRIALPDSFDTGLATQPDTADMKTELNALIDQLSAQPPGFPGCRQ